MTPSVFLLLFTLLNTMAENLATTFSSNGQYCILRSKDAALPPPHPPTGLKIQRWRSSSGQQSTFLCSNWSILPLLYVNWLCSYWFCVLIGQASPLLNIHWSCSYWVWSARLIHDPVAYVLSCSYVTSFDDCFSSPTMFMTVNHVKSECNAMQLILY